MTLENFYTQHVSEPTRCPENEEHNISYLVLTREHNLITEIHYLPPLGKSDYVVLQIITDIPLQEKHEEEKLRLNLNAGNYAAVRNSLSTINWVKVL